MEIDAGTKELLAMMLGEEKALRRLDVELVRTFIRTVNALLAAETIDELRIYRSLGYKYYDGFHQVNVGGDYRLWFTVAADGSVLLAEFDQGNH